MDDTQLLNALEIILKADDSRLAIEFNGADTGGRQCGRVIILDGDGSETDDESLSDQNLRGLLGEMIRTVMRLSEDGEL